jgi:hypothetical protein
MIYVLKIIWDYQVPLLELIVHNIARYPQSATSMLIRYQPAIRYLLPWRQGNLSTDVSKKDELARRIHFSSIMYRKSQLFLPQL